MGYEGLKGPKLIKGGPKWTLWSWTAYVVARRRTFLMYIYVGIRNGSAILDLPITSHARVDLASAVMPRGVKEPG